MWIYQFDKNDFFFEIVQNDKNFQQFWKKKIKILMQTIIQILDFLRFVRFCFRLKYLVFFYICLKGSFFISIFFEIIQSSNFSILFSSVFFSTFLFLGLLKSNLKAYSFQIFQFWNIFVFCLIQYFDPIFDLKINEKKIFFAVCTNCKKYQYVFDDFFLFKKALKKNNKNNFLFSKKFQWNEKRYCFSSTKMLHNIFEIKFTRIWELFFSKKFWFNDKNDCLIYLSNKHQRQIKFYYSIKTFLFIFQKLFSFIFQKVFSFQWDLIQFFSKIFIYHIFQHIRNFTNSHWCQKTKFFSIEKLCGKAVTNFFYRFFIKRKFEAKLWLTKIKFDLEFQRRLFHW